MQFRLTGKNFQSWKQFNLDVNGFTVIIGSSNRGKSALIRALRGVLRNQVQAAHIRKGEKTTEVSLKVGKDPVIKLVRNSSTTNYTVGEEAFSKLGGDVPEPVSGLKLGAISMGSSKLDPIFAGQFDSQFMMDLSPAELNSVFGMFSNTEQLNQGKRAIGQSNAEINSQAKLLATEIQTGHTKIAKLQDITKEFKRLLPKYTRCVDAINSAQTTQTLVGQYRSGKESIRVCRSLAEMALPSVQSVQAGVDRGKMLRQAQKLKSRITELRAFSSPISMDKWTKLTTGLSLLNRYRLVRSRVVATPDLEIPSADKLKELYGLQKKVVALKAQRNVVSEETRACADNDKELVVLHKKLHAVAKDQKACPKCGYQNTEE